MADKVINACGHLFDNANGNITRQRRTLPPREAGKDYGFDPIGDGTVRMVPSGDVVSLDEARARLAP